MESSNFSQTQIQLPGTPKDWPKSILPHSEAEDSALKALMGAQALEVIDRIEADEFAWRLESVPYPPSLGRENPDEPVLPWSVPRSTGWLLLALASSAQSFVELGTSLGYSTLWLCAAAARTGGHVHTVEMMSEKAEAARKNLQDSGFTNWTLHEVDAHEFCKAWKEKIDFLFFDADPESYRDYWALLKPWMAPRSVLVVDNALTHPLLLQPFANSLSESTGFFSYLIPMDNGLLIAAASPDRKPL